MAHAEDFGPKDKRTQPVLRRPRKAAEPQQTAKPAKRRLRVNEITSRIGLTPITGLSGPNIFY